MSKLFLPTQRKDYYTFFQVPARKWWFGLIGIVATLVLFLGYMLLLQSLLPGVERFVNDEAWELPIGFLVNQLLIGGFTGVAVLASWIFYRQGFGWLSSVVGRFRLKWFAITLTVSGAGFLLLNALTFLFFGAPGSLEMAIRPHTTFMIVVILLATPFQAAGEEFLFRGVLGRLIASSVPFRKVGLALSCLISALLFMLMHADAYLD